MSARAWQVGFYRSGFLFILGRPPILVDGSLPTTNGLGLGPLGLSPLGR